MLKFKSQIIRKPIDGEAGGENQGQTSQFEGIITKDAIILEQELSDELKIIQNEGDGHKMMKALGKSFDEVIKRDKNFGRLLTKIKKAYDEYLSKIVTQSSRSNNEPAPQLNMADSSTNTPVSPLEAKQEKEDKKDEILARDNQIRELEKQNQELQSKMVNFET